MNFQIIGDHGSRNNQQQRVAAGMAQVAAAQQPLAILGVGDSVYPDGAEGSHSLIKAWWSDVYLKHSALRRPWFPVTGNHDWYTDARFEVNFTTSSENEGGFWQMPSFWYKRSFSSSTASVDLFFIDTMIWQKTGNAGKHLDVRAEYETQKNWLIGGLAASTAGWRIVVGHHPVYSVGSHGITARLLDELDPILREYNAPLYISGHDHSLQLIQYTGMHYIVSGSGGYFGNSPSHEYPTDSLKEWFNEAGFVGLTICDNSLATLTNYNGDGAVLSTSQLENQQPQPPAPSPPSVRRRRRDADMWACRRRGSSPGGSDYGDTPDGYVCSGNSIVAQAAQAAQAAPLTAVLNMSRSTAECEGMALTDVDKQCSTDGCTVLPDRPLSQTCEQYCSDHGLACAGAWTQEDEDCRPSASLGCKVVAQATIANLICRCGKRS